MRCSSEFITVKVKLSGRGRFRKGRGFIVPAETFFFFFFLHNKAAYKDGLKWLEMLLKIIFCFNCFFTSLLFSFIYSRSQAFNDFLRKCLDKNPETRPTAAQMLEVGLMLCVTE